MPNFEDTIQDAIGVASRTGEFRLRALPPAYPMPKQLATMKGLHTVDLSACHLEELPAWLAGIDGLSALDVSLNPLSSLDAVLQIPRLRHLNLSQTGLVELPEDIGRLRYLETLAASSNHLTDLPESMGEMSNLRWLLLESNAIAHLPETFANLENLEILNLAQNSLRELPGSLRGLTNLRVLDVGNGRLALSESMDRAWPRSPLYYQMGIHRRDGNSIERLPGWLERLQRLEWINISDNGLRWLGPIENMARLTGLASANNKLREIPYGLLSLPNLKYVDLRANKLAMLPEDLHRIVHMRYVGLVDNPIPVPPELLSDGDTPGALWEFLAALNRHSRRLDEAKVLVVGEGSVGKTTLIRRLVHGDYSPDANRTEGIDVTRWRVLVGASHMTLNVWDFGGQEIMHATHQFFLTKRSVYVLVIDARQDEDQNRIEYWLKLINSYSAGSPVIVVGNKCDQCPFDIDRRGLTSKYSNIVGFIAASCLSGEGLAELGAMLLGTINQLGHVRDLLPDTFFHVKRQLEKLDQDYITYEAYERICERAGIAGKGSRELLVGLLHDLGTVLCFRDDPRLSDTNILNPSWVTGGVYRLLNSHLAAQRKGLVSWSDLYAILEAPSYPGERIPFIVDMMRKFELCYESEDVFLIPDLLTKEEPDTGDWGSVLTFIVKYDVLPSSVMCRLIVRMNQVISRRTVWRTGAVFAMDGNRAIVRADREDGVVSILVSGPPKMRRGLLTAIRTQLRSIEQTIPGLEREERVPIPGHAGIYVSYDHLLGLEAAGRTTVVPQGLVEDFDIEDLLAGIESRFDRAALRAAQSGEGGLWDHLTSAPIGRRPWTPRQAIRMAWVLVALVVCILTASVAAGLVVSETLALLVGGSLIVTLTVVSLIVLRLSGRITERGFLSGLKAVKGSAVQRGE